MKNISMNRLDTSKKVIKKLFLIFLVTTIYMLPAPVHSFDLGDDWRQYLSIMANLEKGNYRQAIPALHELAEKGNAPAQRELGRLYKNGYGVEVNYQKAVHWFRKAAVQKDAAAMTALALCYLDGAGVKPSIEDAISLLRPAAEDGNPEALFLLASCYRDGDGVKKDINKAKELYRQAAERNHKEAQKALADLNNPQASVNTNQENRLQNNRLRVFVNHYATYCQKFQYPEKPTNSSLRSFANDLRKISQNLIAVVSQHSDIPNNVKDAALDYALLVRDLSKVVEVAPYLPENKDEAVLKGFFYGLNGDFSGGINEIKVWHQKFLAADQKRRDGYDKYILTLVKHGIQIQTED